MQARIIVGAVLGIAAVLGWRWPRPAPTPPTRITTLVDALRRTDRETALIVVREMASFDRPELRELAKYVVHENPNVQRGVALALAGAPPLEVDTAKALQPGLQDPAVSVREQCVRAIGKSEWKGPEVAALMAGLFDDPSWDVRSAAALALGEQGESARSYIPALNKLMLDDWRGVGGAAAAACRRLGKIAIGAEPGLRYVIDIGLDGEDEAIEALGKIQSPEALHILILTARGKLPSVNIGYPTNIDKACRAIGKFGAAGRGAIHTLEMVAKKGSGSDYSDQSHEEACKAAARDALLAVDPAAAKAMGITPK